MDTQEQIYFANDIYIPISANELTKIIKHVFDWQDENYTDLDVINIKVDHVKYKDIQSYMEKVFNEMNKNGSR